ncbi:hypothetical protein [Demequina aurantiaca]|uniref:hypothetical protein n=1 Tax=Demequina aurantiaca TaxID=676200 RepID=UPI00078520D6|nr:hypothetical protein [Demequina aurantiaca]
MVASVLAIKFRTQRHVLERERWRILIVIGGALWAVVLLPWTLWGASALAAEGSDFREDVLVGATLILTLGWVSVPVLITGLDDTLDPGRFASFGVGARRIMAGLTVAALLTIPVAFFTVFFLILTSVWRDLGAGPVIVAIVGAVLTVLSLVFVARVAAMWSTRVLASRRARGAAVAGIAVGLGLMAPLAWVLFSDGLDAVLENYLVVFLDQVAVTPVGAGMSAPNAAAVGDWFGVTWRLGELALWVLLLWGAWRANVAYALVNPKFRGAGTRRRDDTIIAAVKNAPMRGVLPTRSMAATAVRARLLRYWFSDPRYLANMMGVFVFPVVFVALVMPVTGLDVRWSFLAPVLLAASIGWGRHNDVAYDSSALWLDVVSGRIGVDVLRGRMSAIVAWALPATLVACAAIVAWSGLWQVAPALVGACVGVLGLTLGVSAVSSVVFPYRAPAPGENPLGAEVGSVGAGLVAQLVSSAATVVLLPLVIAPLVLALAVDPRWAWLACIAGLALGPAAYIAGVRLAGRAYDSRAGKLLGAVT